MATVTITRQTYASYGDNGHKYHMYLVGDIYTISQLGFMPPALATASVAAGWASNGGSATLADVDPTLEQVYKQVGTHQQKIYYP